MKLHEIKIRQIVATIMQPISIILSLLHDSEFIQLTSDISDLEFSTSIQDLALRHNELVSYIRNILVSKNMQVGQNPSITHLCENTIVEW